MAERRPYAGLVATCALLVAAGLLAACAPALTVASTSVPATATVPPANPAYPLQVGPTGRYLVDQHGVPVFWSGDAPWELVAQATPADVDAYLTARQQQGMDVILLNLIEHKFALNAPRNSNGDAPFTGAPFVSPNDTYFAHADYVVSSAAQRGIGVLLDPLYLGSGCGDEGWCAEIQTASVADLQSWALYVGGRYKQASNVVWVVGGDVDPTSVPGLSDKVNAFARALQQASGQPLMTAHNVRGQMATAPWPGATWLNVNATYSTFEQTYQQAQAAYLVSPPQPFFQIEGYYEHEHSMTTQQLRAQAYWTILSGGMGYVFGNCPLWGFGTPAAAFCPSAGSDWKAELESPGSVSMVHVRDLFAARRWYDLMPDWDHATLVAGYGTFGSTDYATAARTADGSLVLAYLPSVRAVTVDLAQIGGPVAARWYDPSAGTYADVAGSPFAPTGTQQLTPPGANSAGDGDWVLVLEVSS